VPLTIQHFFDAMSIISSPIIILTKLARRIVLASTANTFAHVALSLLFR
jgi:hypothetical protein